MAQGCTDLTPTDAAAPAAAARTAEADLLARGLARALSDPAQRRAVFEELRDSPFPRNGVHLSAYLRGGDGAGLARAVAEGAGLSTAALDDLLEALPALELSVPRTPDRMAWRGSGELVVAASLAPYAEFAAARSRTGYAPDGTARGYDPRRPQDFVVLLIRPAGDAYGADPEAARRAAPERAGSPLLAPGGAPRAVVSAECDPYARWCPPESGTGMGASTWGYALASTVTFAACTTAPADDADLDGLSDGCEQQIAHAFRPQTLMHLYDGAPEREPYWTVRKLSGTGVQVLYLLSYHHDPGEVTTGLTAHNGDSEFIVLTVVNGAGSRWYLDEATLSAHWGTDGDGTYSGAADALEYVDAYRGRPRVYVARNKHANYKTRSDCNWGGGLHTDTCTASDWAVDVPALQGRNIGNYTSIAGKKLLDCVYSASGGSLRTGQECFFTGPYFAGWAPSPYRESSHAGAYRTVLRAFYFMPQLAGTTIGECDPYAKYCG